MVQRRMDLEALEANLGYTFKDRSHLQRALSHVSSGAANYQRLEFLGDRVLGLAMAEMLYAAYPSEQEGHLSQRFSELVRRETCADVARAWEAGPFLKLASGEAKSGGRDSTAILADVCESILGAVFLDGGYDAARALVERAFSERMRAPSKPFRDPKTMLQEWSQGRGLPIPQYFVMERSGPEHSPIFVIGVKVKGQENGVGRGRNKRLAEQDAARAFLIREGIWKDESDERPEG